MFGLNVFDKKGSLTVGENILVGALGDTVYIAPKSEVKITPVSPDFEYTYAPCGGEFFGGLSIKINADGSAFVDNPSASGFHVVVIRGNLK